MNAAPPPPEPTADRFTVAPGVLRMDRWMRRAIILGGMTVLLVAFGIFVFIFAEILPLFRSASVQSFATISTEIDAARYLGADDWTDQPFVLTAEGELATIDLASATVHREALPLPPDFALRTVNGENASSRRLLLLSTDGRTLWAERTPPPAQLAAARADAPDAAPLSPSPFVLSPARNHEHPVEAAAVLTSEDRRVVVFVEQTPNGPRLQTEIYERPPSLFQRLDFPANPQTRHQRADLPFLPVEVLLGLDGNVLVLRAADGELAYLHHEPEGWAERQRFQPFPAPRALGTAHFLQGGVTLSLTDDDGQNVLHSLAPTPDGLRFVATKNLPRLDGAATAFGASGRNKAFLLADANAVSLRYATTGHVRWRDETDVPVQQLWLGDTYDRILTLDTAGTLRAFHLDDPHPEASFRAFFGKIWYEGQDRPRHLWQSTGGTDDFEPKFSLVPLLFGSLKGVCYALIFAVPLALLAAIYTSQFLHPSLKRIVKPTMEIMASLPSVVLGFLGALWLAPLIETRVPSLLLVVVAIFGGTALLGFLWRYLPQKLRSRAPGGSEFLILLPALVVFSWAAWNLGPVVENLFFTTVDPVTGLEIADFRLWWSLRSGETFEQRNALVIGIMMGFAIIPILFTLSEEALSSVPPSLVSASLALGASRWQTAARIVLPSASAGIFSALMIGLGRAVGETMIVVMATGNTPIMDWDLFNGMRTLTANIAVELPEAAHHSTHYRTLFLGACILFLLTFAINTLAEHLRQKLRRRYLVIG